MSPEVSVLIPTLEGERDLARLLPALRRQAFDGEVEYRAIDSSSGDGTVALLRGAGFDVETIPRSEFGHGTTRNRLAAGAAGDVLVFLSQDALPVGEHFLGDLVAALDDPSVAGAVARVVSDGDADPLTRRTVDGALEASEVAWRHALAPGERLADLPPRERAERMRFNNVASCVRADVLRDHPFPDVPFAEDCAWAARVLEAGWALASAPTAVVEHAHRYDARGAYRRYRIDAAFHRAFHGHRVRPSVVSVLRGVVREVLLDLRHAVTVRFDPVALLRSPILRTAQVLGQYAGTRSPGPEWDEVEGLGALGRRPGRATNETGGAYAAPEPETHQP